MNPTSLRLPLLAMAATAIAILATPARLQAFGGPPGGPSSNGSYFPNDGTFSAVVRGKNLTGTVQFSTTSDAGAPVQLQSADPQTGVVTVLDTERGQGSTGVSTVFYNGDTYRGNSQGAFNPKASSMTVTFQAGARGQGEQTIEVQTPVTVDVPNVITQNGTTTVITTQETQFVPTTEILYFDSLYLNGFANCNTSNSFPNQKFKGNGQAELQFLNFDGFTPFLDAVSIPIHVTGVRLSNTASAFTTADVRPPSVNEFSVLVP